MSERALYAIRIEWESDPDTGAPAARAILDCSHDAIVVTDPETIIWAATTLGEALLPGRAVDVRLFYGDGEDSGRSRAVEPAVLQDGATEAGGEDPASAHPPGVADVAALDRALEANERAKRVSPETMDLTFRVEDDPEPEPRFEVGDRVEYPRSWIGPKGWTVTGRSTRHLYNLKKNGRRVIGVDPDDLRRVPAGDDDD